MIVIFEKIFLTGINPVMPTAYSDGLSYMECIAQLQAKINEFVDELNKLDVENINQNLANALSHMDKELYDAIKKFETDVNAQNKFVGESLESYNSNMVNLIDQKLFNFKKELDSNTNVYVVDPTSGSIVSIQIALDNVYGGLRTNAITCSGYDVLEITAMAYDDLDMTAFSFDTMAVYELY